MNAGYEALRPISLSAGRSVSEAHCIEASLWRWTGSNGGQWFFVTVSGEMAETVAAHALMRRLEEGRARGFGSVKVTVTIGQSLWRTSLFPDRNGGWILPIKTAIRRAEDLTEGDIVPLTLELL